MRVSHFSFAVLLVACASKSPPPTSAPRPGCRIANAGPVVGYTYRNTPPPQPTAGTIGDGTYDLVEIVRHTSQPGPWSSGQAPAFRWAMQFKTTETSSNHTSGILLAAVEVPPSVSCGGVRFATFQNELRVEGGFKGIESVAYTAQGNTLAIVDPDGDGGDPVTYVFRRR